MTLFKRRLLALLSTPALLAAGCASAHAPAVEAAPAPAEAHAVVDPALWKVADEDTTIYLFGTIHALPQSTPWFDGAPAEALAESQVLVTEIAPGATKDPVSQQFIMGVAVLPAGESLRDMLGETQRAEYEAALAGLGIPANAFDRFDPWFAAMTLTMLPLIKAGYTVEGGVEQVVEANAPEDATREALETVQSQIGVFEALPTETQVEFLMTTAQGIDQVVPTLDAIVAAWKAGDADKLAELMNAGLTDPELAEALLYARNRNWADWIDTRLDRPGTVFVAVGAGHLAGENSVQDYLEARGIETDRVQ